MKENVVPKIKVGLIVPGEIVSFVQLAKYVELVERLGFDGLFFFDHLWPRNRPENPALDSLIGTAAVLNLSEKLFSGPMVLRITMRGADKSFDKLATLVSIYGSRLICALGTGDTNSINEDVFVPNHELSKNNRLEALELLIVELKAVTSNIWLGGVSQAITNLAVKYKLTVNVWDRPVNFLKTYPPNFPITWSGQYKTLSVNLKSNIQQLIELGVTWIILGWTPDLKKLATELREFIN
jgi:alkanesulfonate monooxygenase SsuD/methylene tetrahydromethanopterin reductase-like flavin-dependent oxidoreductase (luciferase family)